MAQVIESLCGELMRKVWNFCVPGEGKSARRLDGCRGERGLFSNRLDDAFFGLGEFLGDRGAEEIGFLL